MTMHIKSFLFFFWYGIVAITNRWFFLAALIKPSVQTSDKSILSGEKVEFTYLPFCFISDWRLLTAGNKAKLRRLIVPHFQSEAESREDQGDTLYMISLRLVVLESVYPWADKGPARLLIDRSMTINLSAIKKVWAVTKERHLRGVFFIFMSGNPCQKSHYIVHKT